MYSTQCTSLSLWVTEGLFWNIWSHDEFLSMQTSCESTSAPAQISQVWLQNPLLTRCSIIRGTILIPGNINFPKWVLPQTFSCKQAKLILQTRCTLRESAFLPTKKRAACVAFLPLDKDSNHRISEPSVWRVETLCCYFLCLSQPHSTDSRAMLWFKCFSTTCELQPHISHQYMQLSSASSLCPVSHSSSACQIVILFNT